MPLPIHLKKQLGLYPQTDIEEYLTWRKAQFVQGVERTKEEAEVICGKRGPQRVRHLVEEGKKEQEE